MFTIKHKACHLFELVTQMLVIVVMISAVTPVSAQGETKLRITPDAGNVPVGGTINVTVEVRNGSNLNAYDLTIVYDAEIVTMETWENGDYLSNLAVVKQVQEPGLFRLVVTQLASAGVSGDGALLNLVFRANTAGSTQVTIREAKLVTSTNELVFPELLPGVITITTAAEPTFTSTATITPSYTAVFTKTPTRTITPTLAASLTKTQESAMARTSTPRPTNTNTTTLLVTQPIGGLVVTTLPLTTTIAPVREPTTAVTENKMVTSVPGVLATKPAQQDGSPDAMARVNVLLWGLAIILLAALGSMAVVYARRRKRN